MKIALKLKAVKNSLTFLALLVFSLFFLKATSHQPSPTLNVQPTHKPGETVNVSIKQHPTHQRYSCQWKSQDLFNHWQHDRRT